MCSLTTLDSAPKSAIEDPTVKTFDYGKKALTVPVSSPMTHLTIVLLPSTNSAETI